MIMKKNNSRQSMWHKASRVKRLFTPLAMALALSHAPIVNYAYAAQFSPNFKDTDIGEFVNIVGRNLQKNHDC